MNDKKAEKLDDTILLSLAQQIREYDSNPYVMNFHMIKQVLYTYKSLKHSIRDLDGVNVTYKLFDPYTSMGSVSVVDENIIFEDLKYFAQSIELASNFEVYSRTDGTVKMDFTFHGLARPIK